MKWTNGPDCKSRAHCDACRSSKAFRESIVRAGMVENERFECPEGIAIAETPEERVGLGTRIERLVKPFAVAINHPCLDEQKQLKQGSPCQKIRDGLNRLTP